MSQTFIAKTLDVSLMRTLARGSDVSDLAETREIGRDRWRRIHCQARRIAQKKSESTNALMAIPALPKVLLEPRPARVAKPRKAQRPTVPKSWLAVAAVVITIDVLIVIATVLARSGLL